MIPGWTVRSWSNLPSNNHGIDGIEPSLKWGACWPLTLEHDDRAVFIWPLNLAATWVQIPKPAWKLNSHMDLENGHPWQYLDLDEWMHNINWTTTYPSINPCIHKPLHVSFHLYKERHEENLLMLLANTLGWGQLITARPRLVSASQHLAVVPQIPQCLG